MKQLFYSIRAMLFLSIGIVSTAQVQAQCPPVTGITHNSWRCDSASISWPLVSGVTNYIYAVNQSFNPPSAGALNTTGSALVGNLQPSTRYYVHVRSNCSANVSNWAKDSFTTPACAAGICLAPTTFTSSNITNNSITYSWPAFNGAVGYEYVVDQTFNAPTGNGTPVTGTTVTKTGLTPGTLYYFHVRTQCGANSYSAWKSGPADRTTGTDPNCPTPSQISALFLRCDTISLTWPDIPAHTSYLYSFSTSATPSVAISLDTNFVARRNLTAGTLYYAHVLANCDLGRSAIRTDTFRTPACGAATCLAPATVSYANLLPNSVTVSWTAATGATGYEYVINQTAANPTANGTATTATSVPLTGLTPGTTYYWHIRTKCGTNTYSPWKPGATLITPRGTGISSTAAGNMPFITVYPNPASQSITIDLGVQPGKNARLTIFSIDGRTVKTLKPSVKAELDIQDLQSGIYFIRYADEDQSQIVRFTKE